MMVSVDYWVQGVETAECPVSLITPQSFELVQLFVRSAKVREETGTVFDLSRAPGSLYDAAAVIQEQKARADVERMKAVQAQN